MYTVLIVDDEKKITDSLTDIINWQEYGFSTVMTAHNGADALQLIDSVPVHFLLTDIKMPQMDGLTLLKHVRNKHPQIHCIVLTAYNEFEYARESLTLGVVNYLLKPINLEELVENVKKIADLIFSQKKIDNNIFYNNILLRWLNGSINKEELINRSALLDINLFMPFFTVLLIHFDSIDTKTSSVVLKITEQLKKNYTVNPLYSAKNLWTFILSGKEFCNEDIQLCIKSCLNGNPGAKVSLGSIVNNMEHLHISYKHALMLLESDNQETTNPDTVFSADDNNIRDHISNYVDSIIYRLPSKLVNRFRLYLIDEIIWPDISSVNKAEFYLQELNTIFMSKLKELPQYAQHIIPYSPQSLSGLPTFQEFEKAYNSLSDHWTSIISKAFLQYTPIIQHAIDELAQQNISNFSTKSFCSNYRINTSYFCTLFKKETNFFIGEYLMSVKINYAINYLCTSNKKIAEISDMLGFSSPSYFIKCFRKQTGVSPNHYKHFYKNPQKKD